VFARSHAESRSFVRLDGRQQTGEETLKLAQSFLAAGFPFVLGFPVSSAVGRDAEIPFPTVFDSVRTGAAALAVGYDDSLRIRSDEGAVLIRTSWGADWGNQGHGWLPYAFIRERIAVAVDLWTLLKRSWLRSGEFSLPSTGTITRRAEAGHFSPAGPSTGPLL